MLVLYALAFVWQVAEGATLTPYALSMESRAAQADGRRDPRLILPTTLDRQLKSEIEAAATSGALEQVLARHQDQSAILIPRIEALAVEEIRREGPRDRYVIPGLEPDQGAATSITLNSGAAGMTLVKEFAGDTAQVRFSDGSVHRFIGRFPFADVLTLFGEGDKDHRLTFAVLDEIGMVYIRGRGRVVVATDGTDKIIQLGSPK